MGGSGAPGDLAKAHLTQVWLATSEDAAARVSGAYFYHQTQRRVSQAAQLQPLQDRLLAYCSEICGVELA